MFEYIQEKKTRLLLLLLVLFHLVGLFGILNSDWREGIVSFSGINLLVGCVLLLLAYGKRGLRFYGFALLCFSYGILVELIGVHTGLLFGHYRYGEVLGISFYGVPLVIGLNWLMLVLSTSALTQNLKISAFWRATLASALMVGLDYLIEPIAIALAYWDWFGTQPPFWNYLCWFILAWPLNYFYQKARVAEQNRVAIGLYVIFFLFFGILNLML